MVLSDADEVSKAISEMFSRGANSIDVLLLGSMDEVRNG
jgi:hypothetical protein